MLSLLFHSSEATGRSCFACVFQMGKEEGRFFHLWPGGNKPTTVCGRGTFQNPPGKGRKDFSGSWGHGEAMPSSQVDSFTFLLVLYPAHSIKQEVRFCVYFNQTKDHYEVCSSPACFCYPNTIIRVKMSEDRGNDGCQDQHAPVTFQGPSL